MTGGAAAGEGLHMMDSKATSMVKWLGPGAVMGGLGAAVLCGAGLAGADTVRDGGPGDRGARAASSQAASSPSGADDSARSVRPGPARASAAYRGETRTPRGRVVAPTEVSARDDDSGVAAASAVSPGSLLSPGSPLSPVSRPVGQRAASNLTVPAAAAVPAQFAAAATGPVSPAAAASANPTPVVPSSLPVDPAQYAGTYYEQGSVKQLFSIGLVNTKAVYTLRPDGSLGVRNSGNYFFRWGPRSAISGAAVPVNPINTALNVGFGGSTPSANPPGNYWIIDRAPDYGWVIVSDPSGRSGFILTRSQTVDPKTYQRLVAQARALGVTGRITPTRQIPG